MQVLRDSVVEALKNIGLTKKNEIIYNPSYEELYEAEMDPSLEGFEKAQLTELDAVNVMTGKFTGRSPKDKFIVKDDITKDTMWWNSPQAPNDNKPTTQAVWNDLKALVVEELDGKRLFVVDTFCGANEDSRLKVRFVVEVAWQAHFVTNMFIRPTAEELRVFEPEWTVVNAPGFMANAPNIAPGRPSLSTRWSRSAQPLPFCTSSALGISKLLAAPSHMPIVWMRLTALRYCIDRPRFSPARISTVLCGV